MPGPRVGQTRVIQTRSGFYRVAWIPLPYCPIPGWNACAVQAAREDALKPVLRLTLYERGDDAWGAGPEDGPSAA